MGVGKIIPLLVGVLAAICGLCATVGSSVLAWAHATQRDAAGFYTTSTERLATSTYALTSNIDLGRAPGERDWTIYHPVGTLRISASSHDQQPLFIGIAPQADVDHWLSGVAHEQVRGANFGPFHTDSTVITGQSAPTAPLDPHFWAASTSGSGSHTLLWPSKGGKWAIVVMRNDPTSGFTADVTVGAKTGVLLPIGIGMGAYGLAALVAAALMIFFALRHQVLRP